MQLGCNRSQVVMAAGRAMSLGDGRLGNGRLGNGQIAGNRRLWRALLWFDRGVLAILAWLVWLMHFNLTARRWLEIVAAAVAGLVFHQIARRNLLGWPTDANGKRQKLMHWNWGVPDYWRMLLWADRAALVWLAWWGWTQGAPLLEHWRWAEYGAVVIAAIAFHHIARQHALGWFTDANGERQKVMHWNRGFPIYRATTRSQRLVEEAEMKQDRRTRLLWSTVTGWPLLYCARLLGQHGHHTLSVVANVVGGFIVLVVWLPFLFTELLYQLGYQDMQGAKVLDPAPYRPGPEAVAQQKAHGDADIASEAEARDLLRGRR